MLDLCLDKHVTGQRVGSPGSSVCSAAQWGPQLLWRAVKKMKCQRPKCGPRGDLPSLWILWNSSIWIFSPMVSRGFNLWLTFFFKNLSLKICFELTKIAEWKGRHGVSPGPLLFHYVLYTLWNSPRPSACEISYSSLLEPSWNFNTFLVH